MSPLNQKNEAIIRTDRVESAQKKIHTNMNKVITIGPIPQQHELEAYFLGRGWSVLVGKSTKETRKLAVRNSAMLVVLPVRGETETGWLSCAKLTRAGKKTKVILVGPANDEEAERFALFAGAKAYLSNDATVEEFFALTVPKTVTQ